MFSGVGGVRMGDVLCIDESSQDSSRQRGMLLILTD